MKIFNNINIKDYSIFFWLVIVTIFGILTVTIYSNIKNTEVRQIESSLDNIYLVKTIKQITENLDPRYTTVNYTSKSGDTYESIINNLEISKNEKKLLKNTILDEKLLKVLRINIKQNNIQELVRFCAYYRIKPHAPPLV